MALEKYEVVSLPKVAVRHNFGDKLGMVTISEKLLDSLTDDVAQECVKHGLPYFKKKEGVEAIKKAVANVSKSQKTPTKANTSSVNTESVATA